MSAQILHSQKKKFKEFSGLLQGTLKLNSNIFKIAEADYQDFRHNLSQFAGKNFNQNDYQ
jgi:hypothetical protein